MKLLGPEGVNGIDMAGRNPLHLAAMNNNVKIARKLIQHGASVNKPNTVNGTTLDKSVIFSLHAWRLDIDAVFLLLFSYHCLWYVAEFFDPSHSLRSFYCYQPATN